MGFIAIAQFAIKAIGYIKQAVAVGKDVKAFIDSTNAALEKMRAENRGPTPEEWAALDAESKALSDEIQNAKP